MRFVIKGRFISFNEYSNMERASPYKAAKQKKTDTERVAWVIRASLRGRKTDKPVVVSFLWYEPNRRRDIDNITNYGHKVILDGMVRSGLIPDDGEKYVVGLVDRFAVDKDNPRVVVDVEEVTE